MGFIKKLLKRDGKEDRRRLTKEKSSVYSFRGLEDWEGDDHDDFYTASNDQQANTSSRNDFKNTGNAASRNRDSSVGNGGQRSSYESHKEEGLEMFDHSFPILSSNHIHTNHNSQKQRHKQVIYPDSTDSEFDSDSNNRPHLMGGLIFPGNEEEDSDDDHYYFSQNQRSQQQQTTASKSLPDPSSMIRHHYIRNKQQQAKKANPVNNTDTTSIPSMIMTTPGSHGAMSSNVSYYSNSSRSANRSGTRSRSSSHRRKSQYGSAHPPQQTPNTTINSDEEAENDDWLKQNIADTIGQQGVAADMESLSGRSRKSRDGNSVGGRSYNSRRSYRSHRSRRSSNGIPSRRGGRSIHQNNNQAYYNGDNDSVASSLGARSGFSKHLSQLEQKVKGFSDSSPEQQYQQSNQNISHTTTSNYPFPQDDFGQHSVFSGDSQSRASRASVRAERSQRRISSAHSSSGMSRSASANTFSSSKSHGKFTVTVPSGKLGVILANNRKGRGTIISEVRTSSVLYGKIASGDRLLGIDDEDVSGFVLDEVTAIMRRVEGYERTLTLLRVQQPQVHIPTSLQNHQYNMRPKVVEQFDSNQDFFKADFDFDN